MSSFTSTLFFYIFSAICSHFVYATTFAGGDKTLIQAKDPAFLEKIGVKTNIEKIVDEEGKANLLVTFISSEISDYDNIRSELLYVDSKNQLLLVIEKPFANASHLSRYIIAEGHTLMISIVTELNADSKHHKIILKSEKE